MKKFTLSCIIFFMCVSFTYTQPVKLDSSFGINGFIKTDAGKNNYNYGSAPGSAVLIGTNGSMYMTHGSLSKWRSNGSLDSAFGVNGSADPGFFVANAAIQPDGKIVVVGTVDSIYSFNFRQTNFAVARFNLDGSLDSSFAVDGKQVTDFGPPGDGQSEDRAQSV